MSETAEADNPSVGTPPLLSRRTFGGESRDRIGIYVHWPFCAQKCPYCDFNSHVRVGGWDEDRFVAAYKRELATLRDMAGPHAVDSVFFGGGTPSLMQARTAASIIETIDQLFGLGAECEITLEANPGSVEVERFRGYRSAGVNRVSVGVQALNDADLRALGRVHSASEARQAVATANAVFDRVSFDLIYARQGQTVAQWRDELAEALALAAGHLSLYQLTIEPGTPFHRWHAQGRLTIPDDDTAAAFYETTQEMTEAAGLPAYETSNHARPGEECRHNLVYWRYQPYVGTGPGAHGRMPAHVKGAAAGGPAHSYRVATTTERQPEAWVEAVLSRGQGLVDQVVLSPSQMADEMVLMGLRLSEGLDLSALRDLTGMAPQAQVIEELRAEGLIACNDDGDGVTDYAKRRLVVEAAGRFVLDAIVLRLCDSMIEEPAGANGATD